MVNKTFAGAALGALLSLTACDQGDQGGPVPMSGEARHPNGLVVPYPEGFKVAANGAQMDFIDTRFVRTPLYGHFSISDEAPPETAGAGLFDWSGIRSYEENLGGGGSGGEEYRLRAWRPVGERWIVMEAEQQSEFWAPTFAVAWAMLESARIEE